MQLSQVFLISSIFSMVFAIPAQRERTRATQCNDTIASIQDDVKSNCGVSDIFNAANIGRYIENMCTKEICYNSGKKAIPLLKLQCSPGENQAFTLGLNMLGDPTTNPFCVMDPAAREPNTRCGITLANSAMEMQNIMRSGDGLLNLGGHICTPCFQNTIKYLKSRLPADMSFLSELYINAIGAIRGMTKRQDAVMSPEDIILAIKMYLVSMCGRSWVEGAGLL